MNFFYSFPQTCVIAKKTNDAIYVGADSRVTTTTITNGIKTIDTSSIRKIYFFDNVGYAIIGNYGTTAIDMLNRDLRKDATAKSIQDAYANFFFSLSDSLRALEHKNPKEHHDILEKGKESISQLIIFGREADSLFIYSIKIYFDEKENNIKFQPSVRTDLMYGGKVEEIRDTLETKSVWGNCKEKQMNKTLTHLLNISSSHHPQEVGGKFWILKVTRKEMRWL